MKSLLDARTREYIVPQLNVVYTSLQGVRDAYAWLASKAGSSSAVLAFYRGATRTAYIPINIGLPLMEKSELHETGHAYYHSVTTCATPCAENEAFAYACEFLPAAEVGDAEDLIYLGIESLDEIKELYSYQIDMDSIRKDYLVSLMEGLLYRLGGESNGE